MSNQELIHAFYSAFAIGDSEGMIDCYHENIVFEDPVFGKLKGERACKMWEMLLSQKKEGTTVTFDTIKSTNESGSAHWVASYTYGAKQRKVINEVRAQFKFKDGKIIEHIDTFDLWKWTRQALGAPGYLLGWSSFMKKKIQNTTNENLDKFIMSK